MYRVWAFSCSSHIANYHDDITEILLLWRKTTNKLLIYQLLANLGKQWTLKLPPPPQLIPTEVVFTLIKTGLSFTLLWKGVNGQTCDSAWEHPTSVSVLMMLVCKTPTNHIRNHPSIAPVQVRWPDLWTLLAGSNGFRIYYHFERRRKWLTQKLEKKTVVRIEILINSFPVG